MNCHPARNPALIRSFTPRLLPPRLLQFYNFAKVISAQVNSCMRHVIEYTRFPRQLKEMENMVRNSRSKDLRE
ncbi:unnamed protein product, partial [Ascophyllum nodosum]